MKEKQFVIGEDSARYLNALDKFHGFMNAFLDALTEYYGEEQGDEIFHRFDDKFDAVENLVLKELHGTMVMELGTDREIVTL